MSQTPCFFFFLRPNNSSEPSLFYGCLPRMYRCVEVNGLSLPLRIHRRLVKYYLHKGTTLCKDSSRSSAFFDVLVRKVCKSHRWRKRLEVDRVRCECLSFVKGLLFFVLFCFAPGIYHVQISLDNSER